MCSATISSDKQLLSTCFEDGAIRMWNLTPKKFKPIPQLVNVSRVNLAGDVMEDIEERNRSVEVKLVYKYRDQLTFWE